MMEWTSYTSLLRVSRFCLSFYVLFYSLFICILDHGCKTARLFPCAELNNNPWWCMAQRRYRSLHS